MKYVGTNFMIILYLDLICIMRNIMTLNLHVRPIEVLFLIKNVKNLKSEFLFISTL